jgi:hypothetical protein
MNRIEQSKEDKLVNSGSPYALPVLPVVDRKKIFFTTGKGGRRLNIDDLAIKPSPKCLLSRNFSEQYYKELSEVVFNDNADIHTERLLSLMACFDHACYTNPPVVLSSGVHVRNLKILASTLNRFFFTNFSVLSSINMMVNNHRNALSTDATS